MVRWRFVARGPSEILICSKLGVDSINSSLQPVVVVEVFDPCVSACVLRDGVKGAGACGSTNDHGMGDDLAACVTDHDDGSAEF